jgi:class 3 adenylate cyclase
MAALVPLDARVVPALRRWLLSAPDAELRRVDPVRLAAKLELPTPAVVDALVAGCRAGILDFQWNITCPLCGYYTQRMPHLIHMEAETYCSFCDFRCPVVLDSLVDVTFRALPAIRPQGAAPAALGPEERLDTYRNPHLQRNAVVQGFIDAHDVGSLVVDPGQTARLNKALAPDTYRVAVVSHDWSVHVSVPPGSPGVRATVTEKGVTAEPSPDPGLTLTNTAAREAAVFLLTVCHDPGAGLPPPNTYDAFLSGKELLCSQVFRDLYGSETLSGGIALRVANLTLLFTDLKGSTAMYDAIGDVKAFSLVSEHFRILVSAVQAHQGAVVKTIGDAVMGTFPSTQHAMRASFAMTDNLRHFNATSGLPPLSLKLGVHTGPCIVVNSNERLDYFGQTVNVAARVQALAEGDQLVVTDSALHEPGVSDLVQGRGVVPRASVASLKGVGAPVMVHTLDLAV